MDDVQELRAEIREVPDEEVQAFLLDRAELPSSRANRALVQAGAEEVQGFRLEQWVRKGPGEAPNDAPQVVLVVVGTVGLGRLVAEGDQRHVGTLRSMASDPRWRVREAVGLALQRIGVEDTERAFAIAEDWAASGGPFEQRAAVAGIADPRLLEDPDLAQRALDLVDDVTSSFQQARTHDDEGLVALREALGRAWSVVVAAAPDRGRPRFEAWLAVDDPGVRWVLEENLKDERMRSIDREWAVRTLERLEDRTGARGG